MKRFISVCAAVALAGLVSGCLTLSAGSVLTAADIGITLAKSIKNARADHPSDLSSRVAVYAGLYCDLRESKGLVWDEVRDAALSVGAPRSVVASVKVLIDHRCGSLGDLALNARRAGALSAFIVRGLA